MGNWLKGTDLPVAANAIIILSGPPTRSLYAADLFKHGFAEELYITQPVRELPLKMLDDLGVYIPRSEQIHMEVLLKRGVPKERIHLLPDICKSTVDEAEAASREFKNKTCNIIVVTSPYHVKRTKMIFKDKVKECKFIVLPTPYEPYPEKWWTDQDSARNVVLELMKIVFYKFGGRFRSGENHNMK